MSSIPENKPFLESSRLSNIPSLFSSRSSKSPFCWAFVILDFGLATWVQGSLRFCSNRAKTSSDGGWSTADCSNSLYNTIWMSCLVLEIMCQAQWLCWLWRTCVGGNVPSIGLSFKSSCTSTWTPLSRPLSPSRSHRCRDRLSSFEFDFFRLCFFLPRLSNLNVVETND